MFSWRNVHPLTTICLWPVHVTSQKLRTQVECGVFSQFLSRLGVCNGILFNEKRHACKFVKCNPADSSSGSSVDIGIWDLFWNTYGIHIFYKWLSISLYWSLSFNGKGSIFRIIICKRKFQFWFFFICSNVDQSHTTFTLLRFF